MAKDTALIPIERIEKHILLIRDRKVMLDADLAVFYGVQTRVLNQAVKRNLQRFPEDFMFQLTPEEKKKVITNCDHLSKLKFSKALPFAFTEHGAIMAASVLKSPRAVEISVFIVRAFVKMRQMLVEHKELSRRIEQLEKNVAHHDKQILSIVQAIKQLTDPKPLPKKRRIGFNVKED